MSSRWPIASSRAVHLGKISRLIRELPSASSASPNDGPSWFISPSRRSLASDAAGPSELASTVGMRPSPTPALAAIPKSASRARPFRRAPWRGRGERCFAAALSSAEAEEAKHGVAKRPRLPFRFETGVALFAKRKPRPFPPPFISPPSASFSDALSTHDQSRDRRPYVDGTLIRGQTNGDDAVYASDYFICANDGVGAWAARPRGHAGYVV